LGGSGGKSWHICAVVSSRRRTYLQTFCRSSFTKNRDYERRTGPCRRRRKSLVLAAGCRFDLGHVERLGFAASNPGADDSALLCKLSTHAASRESFAGYGNSASFW